MTPPLLFALENEPNLNLLLGIYKPSAAYRNGKLMMEIRENILQEVTIVSRISRKAGAAPHSILFVSL
jgi:hypothetical protein